MSTDRQDQMIRTVCYQSLTW